MRRIGIWERNEGLATTLQNEVQQRKLPRTAFFCGRHPAELAGDKLDLLVVSPGATGWAGASSVNCRLLLLPGSAGPLSRGMKVEGAISYGAGAQNTITLSSLENETICLAIQRELVTIGGHIVDRQELVLPYVANSEGPELFLARIGALLLLDVSPETLAPQKA